jgi:hypothetical protein
VRVESTSKAVSSVVSYTATRSRLAFPAPADVRAWRHVGEVVGPAGQRPASRRPMGGSHSERRCGCTGAIDGQHLAAITS